MNHSEAFVDFFANNNFDLSKIEKKIDLLMKIALSTDNGSFDCPKERADLFFFKFGLMQVLESAHALALKQYKRDFKSVPDGTL